ncbi:alpha/beta fold hydrolase [Cellulomonas soli]|uniref:alpha/beta fold hydrolase n=1 Tax=Cellulomonas soli TaxID=931535 RepID=UPI003F83EEED
METFAGVHTYRTGTDGPALVLLHGFPYDHRMWDAVAAELPGTGTVVAVDLPGTPGRATDLPGPSLEVSADAVAGALRSAGITRAVVAGLSMGGYVALALLDRHPSLVAGLGLVDTRSTGDTEQARANRLRVADEVEHSGTVDPVRGGIRAALAPSTPLGRPELVDVVTTWVEEQPPVGVAWAQRAMAARPDRTDVLGAFAGPVSVVVGAEDSLTPIDEAEHMVAVAHDVRLVVVPAAGHLSAVEQPEEVAEALADLVARVHA